MLSPWFFGFRKDTNTVSVGAAKAAASVAILAKTQQRGRRTQTMMLFHFCIHYTEPGRRPLATEKLEPVDCCGQLLGTVRNGPADRHNPHVCTFRV